MTPELTAFTDQTNNDISVPQIMRALKTVVWPVWGYPLLVTERTTEIIKKTFPDLKPQIAKELAILIGLQITGPLVMEISPEKFLSQIERDIILPLAKLKGNLPSEPNQTGKATP